MKTYKGPRTTDQWTRTDEKSLADYLNNWKPGVPFLFDATIDKMN